jgi:hypothetical protein
VEWEAAQHAELQQVQKASVLVPLFGLPAPQQG